MIKPSPCFRCTLPDCDEDSPDCARKAVIASARRKMKAKEQLTDEEREQFREYHREWVAADRERKRARVNG